MMMIKDDDNEGCLINDVLGCLMVIDMTQNHRAQHVLFSRDRGVVTWGSLMAQVVRVSPTELSDLAKARDSSPLGSTLTMDLYAELVVTMESSHESTSIIFESTPGNYETGFFSNIYA